MLLAEDLSDAFSFCWSLIHLWPLQDSSVAAFCSICTKWILLKLLGHLFIPPDILQGVEMLAWRWGSRPDLQICLQLQRKKGEMFSVIYLTLFNEVINQCCILKMHIIKHILGSCWLNLIQYIFSWQVLTEQPWSFELLWHFIRMLPKYSKSPTMSSWCGFNEYPPT